MGSAPIWPQASMWCKSRTAQFGTEFEPSFMRLELTHPSGDFCEGRGLNTATIASANFVVFSLLHGIVRIVPPSLLDAIWTSHNANLSYDFISLSMAVNRFSKLNLSQIASRQNPISRLVMAVVVGVRMGMFLSTTGFVLCSCWYTTCLKSNYKALWNAFLLLIQPL